MHVEIISPTTRDVQLTHTRLDSRTCESLLSNTLGPKSKLGLFFPVLSSRANKHPNSRLRSTFGHFARPSHVARRPCRCAKYMKRNIFRTCRCAKDMERIIYRTCLFCVPVISKDYVLYSGYIHRLVGGLGMYQRIPSCPRPS